jgi:hypothetical protein
MPPLPFRVLRWIVFFLGYTRRAVHFPWFSIGKREPQISLNEVMLEAYPLLRHGDVIVHRDDGYASNVGIGGAMIHAGIYVGGSQVVEAIREGVVKRHVGHILYSDYACILRPKFADENTRRAAVAEAIRWAEKAVGFEYDVLFDFNSDEKRQLIAAGIKENVRFCCTGIVHYCYLGFVKELGIHRHRNVSLLTRFISLFGLHPGKLIVTADMYLESDLELIWCSAKVTPEWCLLNGCSKRVADKVNSWWKETA